MREFDRLRLMPAALDRIDRILLGLGLGMRGHSSISSFTSVFGYGYVLIFIEE